MIGDQNFPNGGIPKGEIPKGEIPREEIPKNIPRQEIPKSVIEKNNHPMSWKQTSQQDKAERHTYPIFSDIQEMQDRIQTLYASGSSFAEQKTIDITESEYRMLPFEMLKIVGKNLSFIFITYLASAILIGLGFYIEKLYKYSSFLFPIPLSLSFASLLFYAYVIYAMRQFVIEDEKQPKTKQFYKIVLFSWRSVEFCLGLCIIGIGVLFLKSQSIQVALLKVDFLKKIDFTEMAGHLFFLSMFVGLFYTIFAYCLNRKFKRVQEENMLALYAQYDRTEAINKRLQGEL
ncbi:hypothetical protein BKH42_03520 [Helicobacter sp. 13S00482-2]|uniref:hypothetical protein n=1 Tax=Helicobacter sp. 13S00482-2 TaxID=1476200 RepID=UPI000BA75B23|nr:hypothetical protein [Helicobacter sp. 13S00482-2]PAF53810.1 hypothetical protein BKH42_03520 [Helicobacter sp. 13S00482-2]